MTTRCMQGSMVRSLSHHEHWSQGHPRSLPTDTQAHFMREKRGPSCCPGCVESVNLPPCRAIVSKPGPVAAERARTAGRSWLPPLLVACASMKRRRASNDAGMAVGAGGWGGERAASEPSSSRAAPLRAGAVLTAPLRTAARSCGEQLVGPARTVACGEN
jgi:hypothetical protein